MAVAQPPAALRRVFLLVAVLCLIFVIVIIRPFSGRTFVSETDIDNALVSLPQPITNIKASGAPNVGTTGITSASTSLNLTSNPIQRLQEYAKGILGTSTPTLNWHRYEKYLTTHSGACGGLANMMFRIAMLYGLGETLKRNPFLYHQCARDYQIELRSYFKGLRGLEFRPEAPSDTKHVAFGEACWKADNISKLEELASFTTVHISGQYTQSFKYFHHEKPAIRKVFEVDPGVAQFVDSHALQVFSEAPSHKLCIHLRRGFGSHYMIVSQADFALKAAKFVVDHLKVTGFGGLPFFAVVFSDDQGFAKDVKNKLVEQGIVLFGHSSTILTRVEDMQFAHGYCDSMILTSAGSTFGWWLSYLMREEAQSRVYYNGRLFQEKSKDQIQSYEDNDYIPPEWLRIIEEPNGQIAFYSRDKPPILY